MALGLGRQFGASSPMLDVSSAAAALSPRSRTGGFVAAAITSTEQICGNRSECSSSSAGDAARRLAGTGVTRAGPAPRGPRSPEPKFLEENLLPLGGRQAKHEGFRRDRSIAGEREF